MNSTAKSFRNHLKKFNELDSGDCYRKFRNDDDDFTIMIDKNDKIIIFMENDDKKYAMSFSSSENKFFFQLGTEKVTIYHGMFNKNKISRNIYAANTFQFDEETLWQLDGFWSDKKKFLEEVSFFAIRGMILALEYTIKDLPINLGNFGFYDYEYPQA